MKRKRYSDEQIAFALRQAENGTAVEEICRQMGVSDNGPEFAGRVLDQWAYLNGVELDFSQPGKPTDNRYIEAFNGRLRAECLNASWFRSMAEARDRIKHWRREYNEDRPHMALGGLTPQAYAYQANQARRLA